MIGLTDDAGTYAPGIPGPRVLGGTRWRKNWVNSSSDLAQDRRAQDASTRDVNSIGDDATTHPG